MSEGEERTGAQDEQRAFAATGTATREHAASDTMVDYESDTVFFEQEAEKDQDKDQGESRTSGNVGRMPLVPVVDDAGRGTALNPVPILARSPPGGASSVIGSGESMSAPSGLGSWDDRDRAHVASGSGTPRYLIQR